MKKYSDLIYPNENIKTICFIKNIVKNPNIKIGSYTYYADSNGPEKFEEHVKHHYDFIGDKLIIGKFCSIGEGIQFIMNGANHQMSSVSTYPFFILKGACDSERPLIKDLPYKGNTIVGNDVWFGQNVTVMPGVKIGDGAIIGANSVVSKDVQPYTVVAGNPIKHIKNRFDQEFIDYLLTIKWWNWDEEKIFTNLDVLLSNDLEKIKKL